MGIEPISSVWKTEAQPLRHIRKRLEIKDLNLN
jgi:hypothetical protein